MCKLITIRDGCYLTKMSFLNSSLFRQLDMQVEEGEKRQFAVQYFTVGSVAHEKEMGPSHCHQ